MISEHQVRHGLGTLSRNRYDFNEAVKLNPLHTKGVVFISHKNRHSYNNACQVSSLLQTPADLYILRKQGKYAFI